MHVSSLISANPSDFLNAAYLTPHYPVHPPHSLIHCTSTAFIPHSLENKCTSYHGSMQPSESGGGGGGVEFN